VSSGVGLLVDGRHMAALIFVLLTAMLVAMWKGKDGLATILFLISLVAVALLFNHHVTDSLGLSL
ncbi:MAG: DUF5993 family protein, partial [Phycisphaerales bacterium]